MKKKLNNVENTRLSSIFNMDKNISSSVKDTIFKTDNLIGIEVEALNIPNILWENNDLRMWRVVEEGSVRRGGEFVLRQPLGGVDLTKALIELEEVCRGYKINFDHQTSLHIHIDSRDININQFQNIISIYTLFEPALFEQCGKEREDNIFCLSVNNAPTNFIDLTQNLQQAFKINTINNLYNNINSAPRYCGLNIASLAKFGSIEFRGHYGTGNRKTISNWINILLLIKKYVLNNEDIEPLLQNISLNGFRDTVLTLFENRLPWESRVETNLWKNLRLVHQLLNYNKLSNISDNITFNVEIENYNTSPIYKYLKEKNKRASTRENDNNEELFKIEFKHNMESNMKKSMESNTKNNTENNTEGNIRENITRTVENDRDDITTALNRIRAGARIRDAWLVPPPNPIHTPVDPQTSGEG